MEKEHLEGLTAGKDAGYGGASVSGVLLWTLANRRLINELLFLLLFAVHIVERAGNVIFFADTVHVV